MKIDAFYIGICRHNRLESFKHCNSAFAPVYVIFVISRREVIINLLNLNFIAVIFNDIKEFADVVLVGMREKPTRNNRLSAARLFFEKFNNSYIVVDRIHMSTVDYEETAVAAADNQAHSAVNQTVVNLKLPEGSGVSVRAAFG